MATGTQSRVHGTARVKPTFISASGGKFTAKTMTDISWDPSISTEAVRGSGSIKVVAHAVNESDPKVSFSLEREDARSVRAILPPGALASITFTAPAIGNLEAFDVEILEATVIWGSTELGAVAMVKCEWPCTDIIEDGVSIIEIDEEAA